MGIFRIEIQAVGGHGCQREIGDGGTVGGCGQSGCPDCLARGLVASLKAAGCSFQTPGAEPQPNSDGYARLTHWPGQDGSVVDDLLTGTRTGGFGPKPEAPAA